MPAGISCRVVRKTVENNGLTTEIEYQNIVLAKWQKDYKLSEPNHVVVGASELYDAGADGKLPIFTNFSQDGQEILNAGLLSNSIISEVNPSADRDFGYINDHSPDRGDHTPKKQND